MVDIDGILVSDELLTTRFACDLGVCKGNCCRYGDRGSPIVASEGERIERLLPELGKFLPERNRQFLDAGVSETEKGSLYLREMKKNTPCPLGFLDPHGILLCSLHALALEHQCPVGDYKPFWCRMFPVVIRHHLTGFSLNVFLTEHCHSLPNPPFLVEAYYPELTTLFGAPWVRKLAEHLGSNP
jgi:hypothetical protein